MFGQTTTQYQQLKLFYGGCSLLLQISGAKIEGTVVRFSFNQPQITTYVRLNLRGCKYASRKTL